LHATEPVILAGVADSSAQAVVGNVEDDDGEQLGRGGQPGGACARPHAPPGWPPPAGRVGPYHVGEGPVLTFPPDEDGGPPGLPLDDGAELQVLPLDDDLLIMRSVESVTPRGGTTISPTRKNGISSSSAFTATGAGAPLEGGAVARAFATPGPRTRSRSPRRPRNVPYGGTSTVRDMRHPLPVR
jgi:hypothetical protein